MEILPLEVVYFVLSPYSPSACTQGNIVPVLSLPRQGKGGAWCSTPARAAGRAEAQPPWCKAGSAGLLQPGGRLLLQRI